MTSSPPVWARAKRSASSLASLPVQTKKTTDVKTSTACVGSISKVAQAFALFSNDMLEADEIRCKLAENARRQEQPGAQQEQLCAEEAELLEQQLSSMSAEERSAWERARAVKTGVVLSGKANKTKRRRRRSPPPAAVALVLTGILLLKNKLVYTEKRLLVKLF